MQNLITSIAKIEFNNQLNEECQQKSSTKNLLKYEEMKKLFRQEKQERSGGEKQLNLKVFRNSILFKNETFKQIYLILQRWNRLGRFIWKQNQNKCLRQNYDRIHRQLLRIQKAYLPHQKQKSFQQLQALRNMLPFRNSHQIPRSSSMYEKSKVGYQLSMPKPNPSYRTKSMQKHYLERVKLHSYQSTNSKAKLFRQKQKPKPLKLLQSKNRMQIEQEKHKYEDEMKHLRMWIQERQINEHLSMINKNKARLVTQRIKMRKLEPINCLNLKYEDNKYRDIQNDGPELHYDNLNINEFGQDNKTLKYEGQQNLNKDGQNSPDQNTYCIYRQNSLNRDTIENITNIGLIKIIELRQLRQRQRKMQRERDKSRKDKQSNADRFNSINQNEEIDAQAILNNKQNQTIHAFKSTFKLERKLTMSQQNNRNEIKLKSNGSRLRKKQSKSKSPKKGKKKTKMKIKSKSTSIK